MGSLTASNLLVLLSIGVLLVFASYVFIARSQSRQRAQFVKSRELNETLRAQNQDLLVKLQQRDAVLTSMVEGALAIDSDERVLGSNRAACELLECSLSTVIGLSVQEIVRDYDLLSFIREALRGAVERGAPLEREIIVRGKKTTALQAYATPLIGEQGSSRGVLVVLHDISQIKRLENIRREFVANVSHELRTPITSIKGFVEALLEGAVDNPADARKFLGIISRQVNSLLAIIEDLLSLSRVEKESEDGSLSLSQAYLADILTAARDVCLVGAIERRIEIRVSCPEDLVVWVNSTLLEQAIVNLVENAIKYSEPEKVVQVMAEQAGEKVMIRVHDQGCGIPESELPRIFERFYRVDKGRDRKSRSTGLGLAIVKHVILAHRGKIAVESTPGLGSCFIIELPSMNTTQSVAANEQ